ncbi:MAG: DUF3298 domain-containing protein [Rickettsiales bacterium]
MLRFIIFSIFFMSLPYSVCAADIFQLKTYQEGYFLKTNNTKKCIAESLAEKSNTVWEFCGCESSIKYPVFTKIKDKSGQESLNKFFLDNVVARKCEGIKADKLPELHDRMGDNRDISFDANFKKKNFLSIVKLFRGLNAGAAHDMYAKDGFIINLDSGEILGVADIFGSDKERYKKLNEYIIGKLTKEEGTNYFNGSSIKDSFVSENGCDKCSFYVDSSGNLKIVFNPYIVASFAKGIVEVVVPKEFLANKELADVLRE